MFFFLECEGTQQPKEVERGVEDLAKLNNVAMCGLTKTKLKTQNFGDFSTECVYKLKLCVKFLLPQRRENPHCLDS